MEPVIFRFNCAFCGSRPPTLGLSEYLERWRKSPESDFDALLDRYLQIVAGLRTGQSRWLTKKFTTAADREIAWFAASPAVMLTYRKEGGKLLALVPCPVCCTGAGERPEDRYFTEWGQACKVQAANFFYEAGIIIFNVLQALPRWADSKRIGCYGDLLFLSQKALGSIGLPDCPFCGRKTTCLYGDGTRRNPHRCRWCVDACGGMFALSSIGIESDGAVVLRTAELALPHKVCGTIVPWVITKRIERRHRHESR